MSFYVPEGPRYVATEMTRGPWDPDSQHAGPPCALLGREMDRAGSIPGARVVRATFEILRPVPIAKLTVNARVVRPGRSVELVEGVLAKDDTEILRARAWRMRTTEVAIDPRPPAENAPPGPETAEPRPFFPTGYEDGYHSAMEVRFTSGAYLDPGPARAWMRMRVPLVEGEEPTPLERLLTAADSGNGVSSPLDYRRFVFINADLSVAVRRMPVGEWVLLDAVSHAEPDGVGMTDTLLSDERGEVGRATQSLLIASREG